MPGHRGRVAALLAVAIGAYYLLPGAAAGGGGGKGSPIYKTPQEVFKAAAEAGKNTDFKRLCGVLTPDSQTFLAGGVAFSALFVKGISLAFAPEKEKEKIKASLKPLDDVLAKHGLTDAAVKAMEAEGKKLFGDKVDINTATVEQKAKLLKFLVRPVKDKCALVVDVAAVLEKLAKEEGKKDGKDGGIPPFGDALRDLKVEGDTARAKIVTTEGGKETLRPIEFRRIDGSWRIELPLDLFEAKAAPPPPPK